MTKYLKSIAIFLAALAAAPAYAADDRYVTIKGSDTMVHLVTAWAEDFMKNHPDIDVSVTGGGSGTGISALIGGSTHICASSREMKEEEKKQAEAKKVTPTEIWVANDGIALAVHPSNPVNELTMEQLKKIYTGQIVNWKELGGADGKILALSRESSSGTYVFFQEHVLSKQDYSQSVRLMPATSAIVQALKSDKNSIGYIGLGYAQEAGGDIKVISIKKDASASAVVPSAANVLNGSYPVARKLYLYTNGAPTGNVKAFVDFALSEKGQKLVEETGYVTVAK